MLGTESDLVEGTSRGRMSVETASLVNYIVQRVWEREGSLGKTKLVKLLYLIDVEYYRRFGRTLTGWRWRFYHYGPYAAEVESVLRGSAARLDEESAQTAQGHRALTYRTDESLDRMEEVLQRSLGFGGLAVVNRVLAAWALEDLYPILDYAYYETEPMENAQRGDLLDFSRIVRPAPTPPPLPRKALKPQTLGALRERYLALSASKRRTPSPKLDPPPPYDEPYRQALRLMDAEDD